MPRRFGWHRLKPVLLKEKAPTESGRTALMENIVQASHGFVKTKISMLPVEKVLIPGPDCSWVAGGSDGCSKMGMDCGKMRYGVKFGILVFWRWI
jgi:hypothetical protein